MAITDDEIIQLASISGFNKDDFDEYKVYRTDSSDPAHQETDYLLEGGDPVGCWSSIYQGQFQFILGKLPQSSDEVDDNGDLIPFTWPTIKDADSVYTEWTGDTE